MKRMATAALRPAAPSLSGTLLEIADRLAAAYGRPRRTLADPLDGLVQTILSQNTSDRNSGRAFRALKAAFPTWDAALAARASEIERAIRSGGLARIKSRRIKAALAALARRPEGLDLRHLRRLSLADAEARLAGLRGVGPKTRACVLLFCCGHEAFPVDTHVHRVAGRLGLLPDGASAEAAQARLGAAVPPGRALDLHLNLIRLGRERCRPRAPRCEGCPLRPRCPATTHKEPAC
jgi:endonuclease-3